MTRRCTRSGTSGLTELEFKLGSHFALKGSGGQGCLTSSRPNTTEGVVELVQLPTVGVEHLGDKVANMKTCHVLRKVKDKEREATVEAHNCDS